MERKKDDKRASGRPEKSAKKKSRLTRQQKLLMVIAVILAVTLAVVVACESLFVRPDVEKKKEDGKVQETEKIDYGEGTRPKAEGQRKSEDFYTVLIMGRDTGGGGNTDTMLLASYDVTDQKATVMSIPRDTMVNVSWDLKRINSVYNWNGGGDKGIRAVYKEIAQLVGFEPDYQIVVEWDAIGEIVDAMGGVYFDVPRDMKYNDPYQDLVIDVKKGYQKLSGEDAMGVIRWRHNNSGGGYPDGDLGRIKTQQAFLKAVVEQLLQLKNVPKIGEFAKVFQRNVETDLSFNELFWFGQQAVLGGLKVENVKFVTMPNKPASCWSRTVKNMQSYVVPDAKALLELVNNDLSPFVEPSVLSDLDIMSVNADGSISSTSGYVEDKTAAKPPVKPSKPVEETPSKEPVPDGNGNLIDPETGEIVGTVTPETPTAPEGGTTVPPTEGGTPTAPEGGQTVPPTEGGTPTAPEGGTTTPPAEGGTTTAPEGGTTVPPTEGGTPTAPEGGQTVPPTEGGTPTAPEGGQTVPPTEGGTPTAPEGGQTTPPAEGGATTAPEGSQPVPPDFSIIEPPPVA